MEHEEKVQVHTGQWLTPSEYEAYLKGEAVNVEETTEKTAPKKATKPKKK